MFGRNGHGTTAPAHGRGLRGDGLRRSVSVRSALLLAAAAALQITVVMGGMASELGNLTPFVWAFAALIGLAQCVVIADLAAHFPHRAGGTATYAHEAFGTTAPGLAALSSWAYWFAWTPGVAVNLILAAEYLRATVAPSLDPLAISVVLMIVLYGANAFGLRFNIRVAAVLITVAMAPLLVLLLAPLFRPGLFDMDSVWPPALGPEAADRSPVLLVVKWLFVATWAAYGAEMASAIIAESRVTSRTGITRLMTTSGLACLVASSAVPFVATGLVGPGGLGDDPAVVLLAPAKAVFGEAGAVVVGIMLACALLVGGQAFVIASSRTLYQMSCDGHVPRFFQKLNQFGVPARSILCDAAVIAVLLGVFGTQVTDVVASANIGYLVVFVLVPVSSIVIRSRRCSGGRSGSWRRPVAAILALLNVALLVTGAVLWGVPVWLTGLLVLLVIFPLRAVRQWSERHAGGEHRGRTTTS